MSWLLEELKGEVPGIENTKLGKYQKASSDLLPCQSVNADEPEMADPVVESGTPSFPSPSFPSPSLSSCVYIPAHLENVGEILQEGDTMKKGVR